MPVSIQLARALLNSKLRLAVLCVAVLSLIALLSILDFPAPSLLVKVDSATPAEPREPVSCTANQGAYQRHIVRHVELKECPLAAGCDACAQETCAQCVMAGGPTSVDRAAERAFCGDPSRFSSFTSNMLTVRRIIYTHGLPWTSDPSIPTCFVACKPSYNPSVDWKPFRELMHVNLSRDQEKPVHIVWRQSPTSDVQGHLSCSAGTWTRHALVVPAFGLSQIYHGAIDNVMLIFITLTTLGLAIGCPDQRIEVYVYAAANAQPATLAVKGIWEAMLGKLIPQEDMHGCFASVTYGFMFESRLHKIGSSALTDINSAPQHPIMSSWMRAFSWHVVKAFVPTEIVSHGLDMLLYWHQRMPKWMWRYDWARVTNATGMNFVKVVLSSSSSLRTTIRQAQQSAGMISVHGSALTNIFFLRPGSMVIEINIPNGHETAYCKDLPRTWHCVDSLHLGHTTISWRFCGREQQGNKYGKPTSFSQHDPVKVMKLLMERHAKRTERDQLRDSRTEDLQPSLCFILRNYSQTKNWPNCDLVVSLPMLSPQRCGSMDVVGQPFKFNDTSVDVAYPWERSKSLGIEWRDCSVFGDKYSRPDWVYDPRLEALLEIEGDISTSEASTKADHVYVEATVHDAHVLDIKYNAEVDAQAACDVDVTCNGYWQQKTGEYLLLKFGPGAGYARTWNKSSPWNTVISVKMKKQGWIEGAQGRTVFRVIALLVLFLLCVVTRWMSKPVSRA